MISGAELTSLALNAGFSPGDAAIAAAVALAESGGNPAAVGDQGNSVGLWQINLPAHPEFRTWNLRDPQTNATAAFQVWQRAGGSFSPWTAFHSGAYQAYLGGGLLPGAPPQPALVETPTTDATVDPSAAGFQPAVDSSVGGILMLVAGGLGLYWLADALAD
jgi:hypothetical protein